MDADAECQRTGTAAEGTKEAVRAGLATSGGAHRSPKRRRRRSEPTGVGSYEEGSARRVARHDRRVACATRMGRR